MKTNDENYEPFGEEWEKELMKLPKKYIIGLYKGVCEKLQDREAEIKELEIMYSEACDAAGMYQERAIDAEKELRHINDKYW